MNRFAPSGAALLVLMAGLAGPTLAVAQDSATQSQAAPPPSPDDSRYSFHRMGDGFVRLDSRTGQLAQCGWAATGWSCKMVPDERAALENEIGRLQRGEQERHGQDEAHVEHVHQAVERIAGAVHVQARARRHLEAHAGAPPDEVERSGAAAGTGSSPSVSVAATNSRSEKSWA